MDGQMDQLNYLSALINVTLSDTLLKLNHQEFIALGQTTDFSYWT